MWTYFESHKRNLGEAEAAESNHSHEEYKKNHKLKYCHLSSSPFYMFLILDFNGNTKSQQQSLNLFLFSGHTLDCVRQGTDFVPRISLLL